MHVLTVSKKRSFKWNSITSICFSVERNGNGSFIKTIQTKSSSVILLWSCAVLTVFLVSDVGSCSIRRSGLETQRASCVQHIVTRQITSTQLPQAGERLSAMQNTPVINEQDLGENDSSYVYMHWFSATWINQVWFWKSCLDAAYTIQSDSHTCATFQSLHSEMQKTQWERHRSHHFCIKKKNIF